MRILFVSPSYSMYNIASEEITPPLGLIIIGTLLQKKGHDVKVFDHNKQTTEEYKQLLDTFHPELVGVSVLTGPVLKVCEELSKMAKDAGAEVAWGGIFPSTFPKMCLDSGVVDYVVKGEGEVTFTALVESNREDRVKLPNINFNPPPAVPFLNLDDLPFPNFELVEMNRYESVILQTSRGCPYRCRFCVIPGYWAKHGIAGWRAYSAEKVFAMIAYLRHMYGYKNIILSDDNLPVDRQRALRLFHLTSKLDVSYYMFSRVNYTDDELMHAYKKGKVKQIQFGIESGSDRVLKLMQKDSTVAMNEKAIMQCHKHGIFADCSLMVAYPGETIEDMKMTEEFVYKVKPHYGGVKIFHPYPATPEWDRLIEEGKYKPAQTLEGWAGAYTMEKTMNFSDIPDTDVESMRFRVEKYIMRRGYFLKGMRMLKSGQLPSLDKVKRAVEHLFRLQTKKSR
jgi:radical SAM superfamily enzyme YgiQ (UPF0313 family)